MRRLAVLALILVVGTALGASRTLADVTSMTQQTSICTTVTPVYTIEICGPSTPTQRALIPPVKTLAVGAGVPGPEDTVAFPVTITSSIVCFSLDEPIVAYTMGTPRGDAVLYQLSPAPLVQSLGSVQHVNVDPATSSATLRLEVYRGALSPSGVDVKAVWPAEGIDRVAAVIPPTPATATPTATPHIAVTPSGPPPAPPATPHQPTYTPVPTSTATAVPTASVTTTAVPTVSAPATKGTTRTATPGPTGTPDTRPFFVRVCATPSTIAPNGGTATVYAQTKPGAVCTAAIDYQGFGRALPADFDGSPQLALSDGLAVFPLVAHAGTATVGTATVNCTFGGQNITASTPLAFPQGSSTVVSASE
jgi:hypothetical protein